VSLARRCTGLAAVLRVWDERAVMRARRPASHRPVQLRIWDGELPTVSLNLGPAGGQAAYFCTRSPTRGSAASTCLAALPRTARYALMIVGRLEIAAMASV